MLKKFWNLGVRMISTRTIGYDHIDVEVAKRIGFHISHVTYSPECVADYTLMLMLMCIRKMKRIMQREELNDFSLPGIRGRELHGFTVGVIGTGRIGQGVARRCRGFDMKILCYDIYENEAFKKECNAKYVDLSTLLKESDFITIHSPLTPETKDMIGAREFDMMKNDAVIVNTARGGIINEEALYEALKSGSIRGAGLDATVDEPPYDSPLMTLPNCILTPHAGAATKEASSKMSLMAAQNVVDVLTTGDCKYKVNP